MTRPATARPTPAFGSFSIMPGMAVSDEEVPSTTSSSVRKQAQQVHQADAGEPADHVENDEDEERHHRPGGADQQRQRIERGGAELRHGESHGAKRADRRQRHHDMNDAEDEFGDPLKARPQRRRLLAEQQQADAAQQRQHEHLEHVAGRERADKTLRDHVLDIGRQRPDMRLLNSARRSRPAARWHAPRRRRAAPSAPRRS